MSVIDFIAPKRRDAALSTADSPANGNGTRHKANPLAALTPSQFVTHIERIVHDEVRMSLKRQVEVIDPMEIIALAKKIADQKAKYIAMSLAIAGNKGVMSAQEQTDLAAQRGKIEEVEAVFSAMMKAIAEEQVDVKGVVKD